MKLSMEEMMAWLRNAAATHKRFFEGNVFEYTNSMKEGQAAITGRENFSDGRGRVFMHPKWEPVVEQFKKENS